jgi:2,3-bisphosphoglycerate-dependent phosphoglycerate mutase
MQQKTEIVLVRHAECAPSRELPEADWPLSAAGVEQAQQLVDVLTPLGITVVFSSPYIRAVATVRPFAQRVGLEISLVPELRERKLTEERRDDWRQLLQQSWADFRFALPQCESSLACQQRMHACLTRLAARHRGQTLLVASHGNAIALYLHALDQTFGFEAWAAMRNPELFRITYDAGTPIWDRSCTLVARTTEGVP